VPIDIFPPKSAAAQRGVLLSEGNQALKKAKHILIGLELAPVQPAGGVVLVVGIVVAELGVEKLIAGAKHRCAIRYHEQAKEILDLFSPQSKHFSGCPFIPFISAVPAVVVICPVLVIVPICQIAFLVVSDEVVQGEAIVRSNIVDALIGVIGVGAGV